MIGTRAATALGNALDGARLFARLPGFLRWPVSLEEARAQLRRRVARRGDDFLAQVRRLLAAPADAPYRRLLAYAGCELGDLERLVAREGLEEALATLFRDGVYLTGDEIKGRRPVVRGSLRFMTDPQRLASGSTDAAVPTRSGGSRDVGTVVALGLAFVRDLAVDQRLAMHARGGDAWRHALWGVPGGAAMAQMLRYAMTGQPPERWFSQIDPTDRRLHARYRWAARGLRAGAWTAGIRLPRPVHAPLDDPRPILRWMNEVFRQGAVPHVQTFASSAVALAGAAAAEGVDLRGAELTLGGEPVTEARIAAVERTGARTVAHYGNMEAGGSVAFGCLAPRTAGELHFLDDLRALIQPGEAGPAAGLPPDALLVTSLRPWAPLPLVNAALGDQAVVSRRACRCPMEGVGWKVLLEHLRSYEKLTVGGMNFLDTDLTRILEEVLPRRFGGGPTDYQLVEEDTSDCRPAFRLRISPAVGELDLEVVRRTFLEAVGRDDGIDRITSLIWADGGFLQVERQAPQPTGAGKILHVRQSPVHRP